MFGNEHKIHKNKHFQVPGTASKFYVIYCILVFCIVWHILCKVDIKFDTISTKMKTQIDIRKSKKWAILIIALMALSVSIYAQPAVNNLDQLAADTESQIRYQTPSVMDANPEEALTEESAESTNSNVPILLVESSQERKDELKLNPRSGRDVIQVGYFQKSNNTTWYKIRNIITKKPAVNCNICTRVISTPYVVYLKPRVK